MGYATRMTPKKGGFSTPVPALDLTTSLRGDFAKLVFTIKLTFRCESNVSQHMVLGGCIIDSNDLKCTTNLISEEP